MALYIKKPIAIEAFQYDGDLMDSDGRYYVPDWAVKSCEDGTMYYKPDTPGELYIRTPDGEMYVPVGSYILRGVEGELYPCRQDIFEKTYESVDLDDKMFDFGEALRCMKQGEKVARRGWNGKGMYVFIAGVSTFGTNAELPEIGEEPEINEAVAMRTADKSICIGWLASQADMLAEDWQIVD